MASSSSSAAPSTAASRGAVSHDLIPCLLVGLYAIGVHGVATSLGRVGQIAWALYLPYAGAALCALALAGLAIVAICALHHHPGRPLRLSLPQELSRWGLTATGAASGIGLLLLLPFFLSLFSSFKSLIPLIVPFSWDGSLAVMDRQLHGGIDPLRWFLPLLDHGLVVAGIDFVYHSLWSFGLFALWSWQVIDRRRPVLRLRFLLALPVIWIGLGSIAATLLSSAGPCYFFAVIDAPDPFA